MGLYKRIIGLFVLWNFIGSLCGLKNKRNTRSSVLDDGPSFHS